jgi:hypothetical protein
MHRPKRALELMLWLGGVAHQAVKRFASEKLVHKRPQADLTCGAKARRKASFSDFYGGISGCTDRTNGTNGTYHQKAGFKQEISDKGEMAPNFHWAGADGYLLMI